jgi:hypothetical protein
MRLSNIHRIASTSFLMLSSASFAFAEELDASPQRSSPHALLARAQVVPQPVPSSVAPSAPLPPPAAPAPSSPGAVAELPQQSATPVAPAPSSGRIELAPAQPEPALPPSPAPVAQITAAPGKGFTIKYGDVFSFNLRSRFQLRYQLDIPPEGASGERNETQLVNVGTARLWFSGNVFEPGLTYMLQLAIAGRDYREGAISPIFDAYLDWKVGSGLALRAGQFFVPFDRLRTVREFALQMADRPVPIGEFTLDRDVGVVLYSEKFLGSPLTWRAGVFGGGGTNLGVGKEPGSLVMARLELRPLGPIDDDSEGDLERRALPGLAIGAGIARNWNTNRQRSTTGTTFANGGTTDYLHLAADAVFKWQGFALQLEYLYKNDTDGVDAIRTLNADDEVVTEWTRSGSGWVAQASYTFDPPFEIVGRYSKIHAFADTDPRLLDADELGAGLNYYVNGHQFKIQTDWIAKVPAQDDFKDAAHVVHAQLDATF